MSDSDILLVQQAQAGDAKAFELLVRRYQGKVASVIARTIADPEKVQDLTQEVFLKAYRAMNSFRGDSAFFTWIYRIAINTAKNHLIASGRTVPTNDVNLEDADLTAPQLHSFDTPEHIALRNEMLRHLQHAIDGLAPSMRQAIELRELEGRSYEEIAKIMDCPIGTVRSRIFRGRQEIADQLKDYMRGGAGHLGS